MHGDYIWACICVHITVHKSNAHTHIYIYISFRTNNDFVLMSISKDEKHLRRRYGKQDTKCTWHTQAMSKIFTSQPPSSRSARLSTSP